MRRRTIVVALMLVSAGSVRADDPTPPPEVKAFDTQVSLPAVPSFELPPPEPGLVDPRTLRVRGKQLLDTQVKVKGYIIWIYDCYQDIKKPKESRRHYQKRIDADPTLCQRPKLYLGSTRDTPAEKGLWVVDVPRPPNKLEKERLPKEELAAWPKVPKYKLGDFVVITGDFKVASPHHERNSDGLIVFSAIEPAKPAKPAKATPAAAVASSPAAPARTIPARPAHKPIDQKSWNAAVVMLNLGNKRARGKQFVEAIQAYKAAIKIYPRFHTAWYGLGAAYLQTGDWEHARDAFEHTVALRPDIAMYQMWTGISTFEHLKAQARADQAKRANVKPEEVTVDLSAIVFDSARDHLELALVIEPKLWRAHYYLGAVHRAGDRAKLAAESFTQAIVADRKQSAPYIALVELYRKWDYTDQAIVVADLGTKELPAEPSTSDAFYVLGMAYYDKLAHKKAVEAYTKAIELRPDNHKAVFQRGQAYFHLKKHADAKRDLEAFVAANPPGLEFARQQAQTMLADLASRRK